MQVMPYNDNTIHVCEETIFKPAADTGCSGSFKSTSRIPASFPPALINDASISYMEYSHGFMFFQKVKIKEYIFWHCHLTIEEETRIVPVNNEERLFLVYMIGSESDYTINLVKGKNIYCGYLNKYLTEEEILFRQQKVLNNDLLKVEDIEEYVLAHFCHMARPVHSASTTRAFLKLKGISESNFRAIIHSKYNCSWEQVVHHVRMKKHWSCYLQNHISLSSRSVTN